MAGTFFLKQLWRSIRPEGRRAGLAPQRGPRRAADGEGAAGPGSPAAGAGAAGAELGSAAARCEKRSTGAGSGARRPGQRRRRLSLLQRRSLLGRVLLLAGSPPPPPQPPRSSGSSSPSRPGRPAGTIPESEGLLPSPAAVGGHL